MKVVLVVVLVLLVVLVLAWCVPNRIADLRWLQNDARLRSELLRDAPPGTEYREVLSYLRCGARVVDASDTSEAVDQHGQRLGGHGYIRAHLGGYWLLFRTDVEAIASFDGDGKLKDIRVFRSVDAP